MYQVKCVIEGIVPLLMNRFPLPDNPFSYTKTRKSRTPTREDVNAELLEKSFVDDKGMFIPADNLRMLLIGNQFRPGAAKILGSNIETKKGAAYLEFCKSCVWVVGPDDPQKVYFKPKRKKWDSVDVRSFITANKGRDIVRRPQIDLPWSLEFQIHVTDDSFEPGKIKELYEVAGLRCGLGSYGPTFGRFIIKEFSIESEIRGGDGRRVAKKRKQAKAK